MVNIKLVEVGRGGEESRGDGNGDFLKECVYYLPENEFENSAILHTSSCSKDLKTVLKNTSKTGIFKNVEYARKYTSGNQNLFLK